MEQIKSTELVEHAKKVIRQYDEGAIMASEVLFNIVNRYVENQDVVMKEHDGIMAEFNKD